MFKPKYKLDVIDPINNIVTIDLTPGSKAKIITKVVLTNLLVLGGMFGAMALLGRTDDQPLPLDEESDLADN